LHCRNGMKDADETDIDCGGSCSGCTTAQACIVPGDCASLVCSGAPPHCIAPTSNDGVKNGTETDVDCGAGLPCADQKHCTYDSDCVHNHCFPGAPGTCVSCSDGVKDGDETGVDCGGPHCAAQGLTCPTGSPCIAGVDCASGHCVASVCAP